MKKFLKVTGYVVLYLLLSAVVILGVQRIFAGNEFLSSLYSSLAPIAPFGITDPVLFLLFWLLFAVVRKKNLFTYCNFTPISWPYVLLYALFGVFVGLFTFALAGLDYVKINFAVFNQCIREFMVSGHIWPLLVLVATNSIYKEITFRGLIFNEMRYNNVPIAVAMIIQALLYGALAGAGGSMVLAAYATLGAVIFGMVFYLGKSIWAAVIVQFVSTMSMVFYGRVLPREFFNNTNSAVMTVGGMIAIIVLLLVLYGLFKGGKTAKNQAALSAGREG